MKILGLGVRVLLSHKRWLATSHAIAWRKVSSLYRAACGDKAAQGISIYKAGVDKAFVRRHFGVTIATSRDKVVDRHFVAFVQIQRHSLYRNARDSTCVNDDVDAGKLGKRA